MSFVVVHGNDAAAIAAGGRGAAGAGAYSIQEEQRRQREGRQDQLYHQLGQGAGHAVGTLFGGGILGGGGGNFGKALGAFGGGQANKAAFQGERDQALYGYRDTLQNDRQAYDAAKTEFGAQVKMYHDQTMNDAAMNRESYRAHVKDQRDESQRQRDESTNNAVLQATLANEGDMGPPDPGNPDHIALSELAKYAKPGDFLRNINQRAALKQQHDQFQQREGRMQGQADTNAAQGWARLNQQKVQFDNRRPPNQTAAEREMAGLPEDWLIKVLTSAKVTFGQQVRARAELARRDPERAKALFDYIEARRAYDQKYPDGMGYPSSEEYQNVQKAADAVDAVGASRAPSPPPAPQSTNAPSAKSPDQHISEVLAEHPDWPRDQVIEEAKRRAGVR